MLRVKELNGLLVKKIFIKIFLIIVFCSGFLTLSDDDADRKPELIFRNRLRIVVVDPDPHAMTQQLLTFVEQLAWKFKKNYSLKLLKSGGLKNKT